MPSDRAEITVGPSGSLMLMDNLGPKEGALGALARKRALPRAAPLSSEDKDLMRRGLLRAQYREREIPAWLFLEVTHPCSLQREHNNIVPAKSEPLPGRWHLRTSLFLFQ